MSSVRHTLSNIVLPPEQTPLGGWEVFCKFDTEDSFEISDSGISFTGSADFFTYFNACSLGKWKRYAQVEEVFLQLEVDSLDGVFQWVGRSEKDDVTEAFESGLRLRCVEHEKTAAGSYLLAIPVPATEKLVIGFTLQTYDRMKVKSGSYFTLVDEGEINPVVLALCTTTFKKEDYIVPNIKLVEDEILAPDDSIARHFEMFVVDNGCTLDVEALSSEHVHVLPNKNVGGAGGFARGMMEAMASERGITHVLLMDDDVSISAESIRRTFNLLSLAKGKYRDAFINGAMLTLGEPTRQYEDVSYVRYSGGYHKVKPDLFVDRAEDIVLNEAISVEVPNVYGAWWFSCIPVKRIREIGLPLPLFIRCDDVDFGLRAKATYMTMNGICVWHEGFEGRFRASVDCYQYVRNYLISIAADNIANEKLFMARAERTIRFNMRFMAYDTVELLLDAIEDYMKGPDFISQPNGDAIMKEKGAKNEQMISLDQLGMPEFEKVIDRCAASDNVGSVVNAFIKVWRTLPYDRHLAPKALLRNKRGTVVYTSSANFAWDSLLTNSIVAIDHNGRVASIRDIDHDRYSELMTRWRELKRDYKRRGESVRRAYREAQPRLTSWDFWEGYLGIKFCSK